MKTTLIIILSLYPLTWIEDTPLSDSQCNSIYWDTTFDKTEDIYRICSDAFNEIESA